MATYTSGTTLSFAGTSYVVTNITYSMNDIAGDDKIDTSHLGLAEGDAATSIDRPLVGSSTETGREVTIEYIGDTPIEDGTEGALVITGGLTLSANARVTQSSVTLAVNEIIRGNATFRVARV